MRERTKTAIAFATAILVVAPLAGASSSSVPDARAVGSLDELAIDPGDPPDEARSIPVEAGPGQVLRLDLDVATGRVSASSTPVGALGDRPLPGPGDVACANTFPQSFRWMGPTTASVALPGVAVSLGGSSCSVQPVEIQQPMAHVRVLSAGSYHGGIQALHWGDDGSVEGRFTVWCGGTFGMTDRPPEDGDAFYEGPEDVFSTQPDLVNCYVVTRGEEHPSEWDRWSVATINWHGEGGLVDARVSVAG